MGSIIDEVKAKIDIVDLISEDASVRLKKHGKNWTGFCPFHANTHTAALVVFPDTGTWKCFGACNDGGSVIDWVMRKNNGWDVTEAVKELARKGNINLPAQGDLKERVAARMQADTLKLAMDVFKKFLWEDEAALAYARDRGWSDETIKAGGLVGFSGRATAAQVNEMRGTFSMYGIDPLSPQAVMVLGYNGDVAAWAIAHNIDPKSLPDDKIHGLMNVPGLIYGHKFEGTVQYLSRRQLPGFDKTVDGKDWKSFNPYNALAGERKPFFNNLHKYHYAEGRDKGERIIIVEGQGDAVAWGQFGVPALALCGSSWQTLVDNGTFERLKTDYEHISFGTDADTPGEKVLTGKNNDFPLTTAFGPMLWVTRMPKGTWTRPNGQEKAIKDANDLAQWAKDRKINKKWLNVVVRAVLGKATPIVLLAADYAGKQQGAFFVDALEKVTLPLIMAMPDKTRNHYSAALAASLYPTQSRTEQGSLFRKLVADELKERKENQEDDEDLEPEDTLGGWYPDDETENSGYLIDVYYDRKTKKIKFAYAHITDMKNNVRQIDTAPFLIIRNKKLQPPASDENIESGAVKLANELGPLKTASFLINRMAEYYQKYFYLEEKSRYRFCASYALFTWVHDSFEALNFLRARGGSGSGKSDLMYLVGLTSYRFAVTLSISSSASYKGIAKLYRSCVMIDEADNLMKKDDGTMEAFLKGRSMKRYSNAMNMMEVMGPNGKTFVPTTTNVYGPTLITMYHNFKDPGIENRCVTFDLSQVDTFTLEQEGMEPGYYPPELEIDADEIRNMALRWRLETWMPKIELTAEQRKEYKLADRLVSPRVNQVLRPMKVLAVLQGDMDLLNELKMIGQANYEDEMIKRAGSFEALILRAIVAADIAADVQANLAPIASKEYGQKVKGYATKVKLGKLGRHGTVRYILYKDLAAIANEMMDAENRAEEIEEGKKKEGVKGKTIGDVSRESFRLPVERTGEGWAVVLQRERIEIAKLRFGLDREIDYTPPKPEPLQAEYPF